MSGERPIRILHVLGAMNRGGVETWLMRVLRRMDPNEFASRVLVHTCQRCDYDEEIHRLGISVFRCPHVRQFWRYAGEFKRVVRRHGPFDVVHSHAYLFSGYVLRLAEGLGIPTRIAHVHPCVDHKKDRLSRCVYRYLMARWLSRHATDIVAPSHASLDGIKSICDCRRIRTGVVPNVVETERFDRDIDRDAVRRAHHLPVDRPLVIYVARFAEHKNHAQFLRVADAVNRNGPRAHFVLVGSYGATLRAVARAVEPRLDVSMFTDVEDVSDLLLASDVFLFPSLNEGFGVVAIEAAAAGLPVVATDLPTIREACAPCMHPFLFPPNDDAAAIGNVLTLLDDAAFRGRVATEGRRFAARFTCDRSILALRRLYTTSMDDIS